jgi:hypothetical protein
MWMCMWPYVGISHIIYSVLCKGSFIHEYIFSLQLWVFCEQVADIHIYSEVCWKFCECLTVDYGIPSQKRFLVHLHLAVLPSLSNDTHVTLGSEPVSHSIYWTLLNNSILVVFSWEMSLIFYSSRVYIAIAKFTNEIHFIIFAGTHISANSNCYDVTELTQLHCTNGQLELTSAWPVASRNLHSAVCRRSLLHITGLPDVLSTQQSNSL